MDGYVGGVEWFAGGAFVFILLVSFLATRKRRPPPRTDDENLNEDN